MNIYISMDLGKYWELGWMEMENLKSIRKYLMWREHQKMMQKNVRNYNWKRIDMNSGEAMARIMVLYATLIGGRDISEVFGGWDHYSPAVDDYMEKIENWMKESDRQNKIISLERPNEIVREKLELVEEDFLDELEMNIEEWRRSSRNWWTFDQKVYKIFYGKAPGSWENVDFI